MAALRMLVPAVLLILVVSIIGSDISCDNHSQCPQGHHCFFSYEKDYAGASGICFKDEPEEVNAIVLGDDTLSALEIGETAQEDSDLAGLTIRGQTGKSATLRLGSGKTEFSMKLDKKGDLTINGKDKAFLTLSQDGSVKANADSLSAGALAAQSKFSVSGQSQWRALAVEDFFSNEGKAGWQVAKPPADADNGKAVTPAACLDAADIAVSDCAGLRMLGGTDKFNKPGGVKKRWSNLPKHKFVRVEATLHYIDRWEGETLVCMIGPQEGAGHSAAEKAQAAASESVLVPDSEMAKVVWQESYSSGKEARPDRNVCGDAKFGESRLSAPVDITIPHEGKTVDVIFRSNFGQISTSARSWGVSNIVVSIL